MDEIFDKNPLFSFKKYCAIIHRYQVRGKISFFTLTSYYYENCGSCFAAEQFVDIRLGAKYLLTLTSYYYEREWKFMAMITLQNSRNAEVTVLTNNFIDNYMRCLLYTSDAADD